MTREETKKAILIMQAYVDGKEVECVINPVSILSIPPDWCWNGEIGNYRIKEEPNKPEVIEMFSIGDYVYSSYHKREGVVTKTGEEVRVYFDGDVTEAVFGFKEGQISHVFLRRIKKLGRLDEEPKPFDWRGKNIQWVRMTDLLDEIYHVMHLSQKGFHIVDAASQRHFKEWHSLKETWQWSENNATWRKFE